MLMLLITLVLIAILLVPVAKVLLGFHGFTEALGAWGVLFIVSLFL